MKFAAFQELHTPRLLLRRLRMEDAPCYHTQLSSSPAVARYMLWEAHDDPARTRATIQRVLDRYAEGSGYRWAVTLAENGAFIGVIDLLRFQEDSCSFAYMLGEAFWGKGYGSECLEAVFGFAFGQMEIRVITADHFSRNPASGAAMGKAGMRHMGTLPGKYEKNGQLWDAEEYRITLEDWKNRHGV